MEIDRLNRMLEGFWRDETPLGRGSWLPLVDIFENAQHEIVIKAELPDMKRDDIQVTVENGTLTLSGERRLEQDVKRENFHRLERSYGSFSRSFTLPPTFDASRISATYKDGVLTVTLPPREDAKPKQIEVTAP
jgi:HSP20 family protein